MKKYTFDLFFKTGFYLFLGFVWRTEHILDDIYIAIVKIQNGSQNSKHPIYTPYSFCSKKKETKMHYLLTVIFMMTATGSSLDIIGDLINHWNCLYHTILLIFVLTINLDIPGVKCGPPNFLVRDLYLHGVGVPHQE